MSEAKSTEQGSWQVTIDLPDATALGPLESALAGLVERHEGTVSMFERGKGPGWRITIHCLTPPDRAALAAAIAAAGLDGRDAPAAVIEPVAAADWLAEYRRRARPVRVGRFFVHPSHYRDPFPPETLPIGLDAGLAFGTGEHESTHGCLMALERLAGWGAAPRRALDLGCGSGILAIAIARLWPGARVVAADNDPVAAEVAAANLAANAVGERVRVTVGEGYTAPAIGGSAPYDIIAANILSDPLIAMAAGLAGHLAPGGHAVLSGILGEQAEGVLDAHAAVGLALVQRIDMAEWTTLILARPAAGD